MRPIKEKVFMVAEAPNGTPPVFLLYYDIVCIFLYRMYSLNNGFLFLEMVWFGFEPKSMPVKRINLFFHHLDDTKPMLCFKSFVGGT